LEQDVGDVLGRDEEEEEEEEEDEEEEEEDSQDASEMIEGLTRNGF
jgi:hypothetical protein